MKCKKCPHVVAYDYISLPHEKLFFGLVIKRNFGWKCRLAAEYIARLDQEAPATCPLRKPAEKVNQ